MKTPDELTAIIRSDDFTKKLTDIYVDESRLSHQRERYAEAVSEFVSLYGDSPAGIYSAPGRSEIGGNHTDHNHGEVLAASINNDIIAVVSQNDDSVIRAKSEGYPMITLSADDLEKKTGEEGSTAALIRGVLAGIKNAGYKTGGFNAYLTSEVLSGSGLSSSAAFETVIGTIISGLYNDMTISAVEIAKIGQYAENVYFGKPCGLMDQMACSVGSLCHIDFKDPENPTCERVDADISAMGYSLCITDTKGSHAKLTPHYAAIPEEMKAVAKIFGCDTLREADEKTVLKNAPLIREKAGDRALLRAIHFFEENKRVSLEVSALKDRDFDGFLNAFRASAKSSYCYLQNVYPPDDTMHENTAAGILLSELCLGENGAVRIHGGGFAGTIQAFVRHAAVASYKAEMDRIFGEGACEALQVRKYGGIKVL